ncbi:MAG TPA: MFS transporter [Hyphomonadaceae bacterium]|jgi:MFS family permease|nr:MFS transporter [Hyphomonadaceae bacterium]
MRKLSDQPWLIVLGSTLALTVGNGPIMQFTFGVFLKPLTAAFGIERGLGSLALTIGLLATAFTLPLVGKLADVLGPKLIGLVAVLLFALGVAAAGWLSPSIWIFMVLFALAGVAAAGQTPLVYLKAISARIDRRRGLALSIALTGVGIGSIITPIIAQHLINDYGWRGAYLGLAALLVVVAVPSLLLFIPGKADKASAQASDTPAVDPPGLTPGEALRTWRFWLLVVCMFLGAAAANGTIAHVVPLLTDRGVSPDDAAAAMSVVAASAIVGRLAGGFLIDRFWAPIISTVFFAGMIGAIGILIFAQSAEQATIATVLLGLGLGVEADLVGFMVSRYLGTRAFGTLFGYAFASFMLGSSLGPTAMGAVFDATGSYALCQIAFMIGAALAAAGFLALGRYPYPAQR